MDWNSLKHAYGNAADTPALLGKLTPDAQASVWEELWSRLCHQDTVYSASFAALPTFVDVAEQWTPKDRIQILSLAAAILASTDVHGGSRDDFVRPVAWVVPRFRHLCRQSLAEIGLPAHEFIYLLQAARSFEGDQFWGHELDHLASGEFPGTCPNCGVDLYLVIGEYGFFATAEEWVQRPGKKPGTIEPRPGIRRTPIKPNNAVLPVVGQFLCEQALAAQQEDVAFWIRHVFGTSKCPSCCCDFDVQDAIVAD